MAITIQVPKILSPSCEGAAEFHLAAGDVRTALEQIERTYPELHRKICDETGAVRQHVNLFVNLNLVRHDKAGLDTSLASGDVVSIFQSVSGG